MTLAKVRTTPVIIRFSSTGGDTAWRFYGDRVSSEVGQAMSTEYEIDRSLIYQQKNLVALVGVERILISNEPTRIQPDLATVLADRDGLRADTKRVGNVDIVHAEVVFMDAQCPASIV
ncbi:hypothetical protein CVT25_004195 [Psilocybe cyanescens]|uniref:Uncharacterized protein n=1 Tax=Psilocybe cyanescens TaxID=93625 RepID=A0A409X352_PSICY|nr:hypothetical protein CVT25_004195 [Psilocybe cyanescens]